MGARVRGSTGALVEGVGALDGAFVDAIGAFVLGSFVGREVVILTGDNVGALVNTIGAFVLGSFVGRGVAIAVGDDVGALV